MISTIRLIPSQIRANAPVMRYVKPVMDRTDGSVLCVCLASMKYQFVSRLNLEFYA